MPPPIGKRVLIIQSQIKQYRVPVFHHLHRALKMEGVDLRVAYSAPNAAEATKADNADLPPEYGVKVQAYWMLGNRFLYQPLLGEARKADLVIIEQASKLLINVLLLSLSTLKVKSVAFWGHGEPKQASRSTISQWFRQHTLKRVDWWFAYTEGVRKYLIQNGFSSDRITNVNNAIDTRELRRICYSFSCEELETARCGLGIAPDAQIGIYCGAVNTSKQLDFLIASARQIRLSLANFHLILMGGGSGRHGIKLQAQDENWIHVVGPQFGHKKAQLLRISDMMLVPGPVGLVILDAFAAGLPLVTTQLTAHGPEIEYLEEGRNGIITAHDTGAYAQAVISLFVDHNRLKALQQSAALSSKEYTLENMVKNLRRGILDCLGVDREKTVAKGTDYFFGEV
jgi:glycosyltransferase involved in cell wall biosynthesis